MSLRKTRRGWNSIRGIQQLFKVTEAFPSSDTWGMKTAGPRPPYFKATAFWRWNWGELQSYTSCQR